jgi:hypothetical protein
MQRQCLQLPIARGAHRSAIAYSIGGVDLATAQPVVYRRTAFVLGATAGSDDPARAVSRWYRLVRWYRLASPE